MVGRRQRTLLSLAEEVYVVMVQEGAGRFRVSRPEVVFDDLRPVGGISYFDVFDQDRFLIVEQVSDDTAPAGVTVMVNWLAELERRIPR